MPLVNRDKDQSEQREVYSVISGAVATGVTLPLVNIPFPSTLVAVAEAVYGLSGAPTHNLWVYRFAGGFTAIQIGASYNVTAFGTSGVLSHSLYAAATFPLLAGDQLVLNTVGANTSVASAQITVVVKALQDIKNHFGV